MLREEFEEEIKLNIYEETTTNEFLIKDAIEEEISSYEDALKILNRGEVNRHFAVTNFNHNSSRSHTLFRVFVQFVDKKQQMFESVCNFVDLAGSERISKFEDENDFDRDARQQESKSINKSLFFLTHIINMIAKSNQEKFIPYRNSPLTKILKNSLGGNSKTAIILCINSSLYNLEQTISTLKFGNLASCIQNNITKNLIETPEENIQMMMREYELKLRDLEKIKQGQMKEEFADQIRELERQKESYMQKYKNLMKLNQLMTSRKQRSSVFVRKSERMEHMQNVGVLHFYSQEAQKKGLFGETFFDSNKSYIK